jgi:hypothetical protein
MYKKIKIIKYFTQNTLTLSDQLISWFYGGYYLVSFSIYYKIMFDYYIYSITSFRIKLSICRSIYSNYMYLYKLIGSMG